MSDMTFDHLDKLPDGSLSRQEVRLLTGELRRLRRFESEVRRAQDELTNAILAENIEDANG